MDFFLQKWPTLTGDGICFSLTPHCLFPPYSENAHAGFLCGPKRKRFPLSEHTVQRYFSSKSLPFYLPNGHISGYFLPLWHRLYVLEKREKVIWKCHCGSALKNLVLGLKGYSASKEKLKDFLSDLIAFMRRFPFTKFRTYGSVTLLFKRSQVLYTGPMSGFWN